jgi:hypothetical protein
MTVLLKQVCHSSLQHNNLADHVNADTFIGYMAGGYNGHLKTPSLMSMLDRASAIAGLVGGEVFVAELPDYGIIGAAIWYGLREAFLAT